MQDKGFILGFRSLMMLGYAALLAALSACTATPQQQDTAHEAAYEAAVFQALVDTLAAPEMEGRGPGTQGLGLARDFIIERFETDGLEPGYGPARGGQASFTQTLTIPLDLELDAAHLAFVDGADGAGMLDHGDDFRILSTGADVAVDGRFGVTIVGYGTESERHDYSSFRIDGEAVEDDALEGRIALAFRYEPMDEEGNSQWREGGRWSRAARIAMKVQLAADHGAVGLLLVNPPSHPDDEAGLLRKLAPVGGRGADIAVAQISQSAFHALLSRDGHEAPPATARALQRRADEGKLEPLDLEDVKLELTVRASRQRVDIDNVAGALPGEGELASQWIVVGAHYDHLGYGGFGSLEPGVRAIHPGADDNASGTAAIIMMAQAFVERVENDAGSTSEEGDDGAGRRSILFVAFSGEERGLLGSRYMVRHFDRDTGISPDDVVAMMNLDMIGRLRPNRGLNIAGVGTSEVWPALIEGIARKNDPPINKRSGAMAGSDHLPFLQAGIPVLFLNTGAHEDYHRPTDTADRINAEGGARVTALGDRLIWALAHEPDRPAFTEPPRREDRGPRIGRVRLGIMPDYGHDEPGVVVAAVAPNAVD